MDGCPEFHDALGEVNEAFRKGLRAFSEWMAAEMKMVEGREYWEKHNADPFPGDEYVTGFNDGVESIRGGLAVFLEEFM